jgi:Pyruvate:ferredoxin oxidoreductase and related 2-oxoacid:ferredoxin oxidoreductases, gamma subunit
MVFKNFHDPITKVASDITGSKISSNIVLLGILSGLTGVVTLDALKNVVNERFKNKGELNIKALEKGYELGVIEAYDRKTN